MSKDDADKYLAKLRRNLSGTGKAAEAAKAEIEKLIDTGFKSKANKGMGLKMILGYDKGDLDSLKAGWWGLHEASSQYNADKKALLKVSEFKKAQAEIEATRAELRGASADYARLQAQFHANGAGSEAFAKAARQARLLDENIQRAHAHTEAADAAYKEMPKSIEAAQARMRAIRTETATIEAQMKTVQERIRALESVRGFDRMAASSEQVFANLAKAESEVAEIKGDLSIAQAKAAAFDSELAQATQHGKSLDRSIDEIKNDVARSSGEVSVLSQKLERAEANLKKFANAAEVRELRGQLRGMQADVLKLNDLSSHMRLFGKLGQSLRTAGYGLYSTITPAIMMAGRYAVQAAEDVDSAYRDMRKTVNGTEEQFEHLKDAAIDFSRTHVTSAETILEIEAMGGQLGISAENLEAFSRTVSNLDIATNMDADNIAESLGKMASVMDINVDEYDNFGDALVRLGNNLPVMEGDIMNMTTRYMGMGKVVGMSADEMLAWSAAGIATGQRAEAAGSAMQRFISKVETAAVQGGDSLDGFAKVAGMSAKEFQDSFKTSASDTMYKFIEGLGRIQEKGGSVNQTLSELKINNVRDKQLLEGLAQQMVNTGDSGQVLAKALKMAGDAYHGAVTVMDDGSIEEAGDAAREAERKSEGFSGELGKMKNNAIAMALELGEGLVPIMKVASSAFQEFSEWLDSVPDETKTTISAFMAASAAIGPLTIGFGSIVAAGSQVIQLFNKFPTGWVKILGPAKAAETLSGAFGKLSGVTRFAIGDFGQAAGKIDAMGTSLSTVARKAGAAKLAIGGIGVGIAIAAIAAIAEHYAEVEERAQKAAKASESMYDRMKVAMGNAAAKVDGLSDKLIPKIDWQSSVNDYNKWIDDMVESYDRLQDEANETFANDALAEEYASQIEKILKLMDETPGGILTADEQAKLAVAVEGYNKATGDSIEITDAEKGALADSAGQAIKTGEAFEKMAEKKRFAAMQEYFNDEFSEKYKAQIELTKQLTDAQKKYDDAVNVLNNQDQYSTEEIHAAYMATKELAPQIDDMTKRQGELQSELNQTTEQMNLAAKAQTDEATSLDRLIAQSPAVSAALHGNYQSIQEFSDALNSMGEKAQNLEAGEVEELAAAWDGSMASIMPLLYKYDLSIKDLEGVKIAGVDFYVTDNGTIYDTMGEVQELDKVKIGDKTYWVDNDGSVKDEKKELSQFRGIILGDKHYIVSNDGSVSGEMASLQNLRSLEIDGKRYYVTSDGTVYDETERIGELESKKLTDKLFKVGDSETISKVEKKIDKLNSKTVKDRSFKITANDSDASSKISKYSGGGTLGTYVVNIVAKGSSTALKAAAKALGGSATGAISTGPIIPEHASGGLIPAHASGALNGIVAKPTLTNIGWVGEDGAEAILHMRNAGGAVIPLSNRRYVRPFARAVAGEMGAGNSTSVVNNINVSLTYDSTKEARQMAQDVANELNAILAMGA